MWVRSIVQPTLRICLYVLFAAMLVGGGIHAQEAQSSGQEGTANEPATAASEDDAGASGPVQHDHRAFIPMIQSNEVVTGQVAAKQPAPGEIPGTTGPNGPGAEAAAAAPKPPIMQGCELSTPDFVVTGSETTVSGDEHCFPSNGLGGFGPRTNIPGLTRVDGMDVADMDGDGDNDFLACDGTTGQVYLYTQGPPMIFTPATVATGITSGVGGSVFCTNLREADFNGDGLEDFVVGDNRVTNGMFVYLQGPIGTFTQVAGGLDVTWASPTGAPCNCLFGVAAGDVDGDSNPDVLVLGYTGVAAGRVFFYKGNGAGGMAAPVALFSVSGDFPIAATPTGLALFDAEGDGDLDIIAGGSADGSHYLYTNDGAGNFTAPAAAIFDVNNFTGIDAYDVDGDNDDDLVLVNWGGRRLVYVQNLGGVLAAPLIVGLLDGESIGIGAPKRLPAGVKTLDHFKCYLTKGTHVPGEPVVLKDQFGSGDARVLEATRFCNPVEKRRIDAKGKEELTPIKNPNDHLKFYRIETKKEPVRVVRVDNQFVTGQTLQVLQPLFLAVPTQKMIPGNHQPPKGLDHFKCYEVKGDAVELKVGLRDQFLNDPDVKVLKPYLLCNPAEKIHKQVLTPVEHPDDHLLCYTISGKPFPRDVRSFDQFGEEGFTVNEADLLCLPTKKTHLVQEPNLTQMCGDNAAVNFDGGMVLPGGGGTGLLRDDPDATWPAGRPPRPCGAFVPLDGYLPSSGVVRFRVAYRPAGDPVPLPDTALGVQTKWILNDRSMSPFCQPNPAHVLQTDADGWMDAAAYLEAKLGGPSTDWCPNSGLRLAVWDSQNTMGVGPADPDGHYVLWLEWDNGGPVQAEPFEHHLQLDNTLPVINDMLITLADGSTPVAACGEAPTGSDHFKLFADLADDHYWSYLVQVRGGNPPASVTYGWHNYYDGTPQVANTDATGTIPDSTTVFLRDIDMNDLGASFSDCCYLLELFVRDAAIRHSFNNRVANDSTGGYWTSVSKFITFAAAP